VLKSAVGRCHSSEDPVDLTPRATRELFDGRARELRDGRHPRAPNSATRADSADNACPCATISMSRSASNTSNWATVGDTGTGDNTNSGTNNTCLRGKTQNRTPAPSPTPAQDQATTPTST